MQESVKILGTDHNECIIDTEKLFSIFDKIIDVYDEPFADVQFNNFIIRICEVK